MNRPNISDVYKHVYFNEDLTLFNLVFIIYKLIEYKP